MLKKTVKFYGLWKDGKPVFDNRELFDKWASSQEGRWECEWSKESEEISQQARGYFYGVVIPAITEQTGHSEEEIEGVLKKRYLTVNKGTQFEYVRSTSNESMSSEEYINFIKQVIVDMTSKGIVIPEPKKGLFNGKKN